MADDEEREDAEDSEGVEHPHAVIVLRPGEPRLLAMSRTVTAVGWKVGRCVGRSVLSSSLLPHAFG